MHELIVNCFTKVETKGEMTAATVNLFNFFFYFDVFLIRKILTKEEVQCTLDWLIVKELSSYVRGGGRCLMSHTGNRTEDSLLKPKGVGKEGMSIVFGGLVPVQNSSMKKTMSTMKTKNKSGIRRQMRRWRVVGPSQYFPRSFDIF